MRHVLGVVHTPTVTQAWVDLGCKDDVAIHGALQGNDVVHVKRVDTVTWAGPDHNAGGSSSRPTAV